MLGGATGLVKRRLSLITNSGASDGSDANACDATDASDADACQCHRQWACWIPSTGVAAVAAAGSMVIADALLSRRPTMPSVSPAARAILARVVLMRALYFV